MSKVQQEFSVLMSVYAKDNAVWISEALDSVINQSYAPCEIIIVLDGPVPQDIVAILNNYKSKYNFIKIVPLKENSGLGIALNKSLKHCSCELVARMDSDDISLPNRFEKQLELFRQNPDLAICGGAVCEVDSHTLKPQYIRKVPIADTEIKKYLKMRSPFNHPSVMFKKEKVLQAGGYTNCYLMEDYLLWVRMSARGFNMRNCPDVLVKMRVHKNMYKRRGGYKYFRSNKFLLDEMLKLKVISPFRYLFNVAVRFIVQVLMPNRLRAMFYSGVLR